MIANVTVSNGEKIVSGPLAYDSGKSEIFVADEANIESGSAVYILSDASEGTSASSSPAVPELSWLAVIPLLVGMLSIAMILRRRKNSNLEK